MRTGTILLPVLFTVAAAQTISYPKPRYTEYSLLTEAETTAADNLGYTPYLWNVPGSAEDIELHAYSTLIAKKASKADDLDALGFDAKDGEETWDCYVNHYYGYDWSELVDYDIDLIMNDLGWTAQHWSGEDTNYPASEDKYWAELTPTEKTAAEDLCYFEESWNMESLEDWGDISRETDTAAPTIAPTNLTPTAAPSVSPTAAPSVSPTAAPTIAPTTLAPTAPTTLAPTAAPIDSPTAAPSDSPTAAPTIAPTTLAPSVNPTAAPSIAAITDRVATSTSPTAAPTTDETMPVGCFSGSNIVQTKDKGSVQMKDVQIGDYIQSGAKSFSRVYSMIHVDDNAVSNFLSIHAKGLNQPLELTPMHILYVNDKAARASQVKAGDMVGKHEVTLVREVKRKGLYAPLTESGDLVVSGIRASSYVALLEFTPASLQNRAAQILLFPLRFACGLDFSICQGETYSSGISNFLWAPIQLVKILAKLPNLMQVVLAALVFFPLALVFFALDTIVASPLGLVLIVAGVSLWMRRPCKGKNKTL